MVPSGKPDGPDADVDGRDSVMSDPERNAGVATTSGSAEKQGLEGDAHPSSASGTFATLALAPESPSSIGTVDSLSQPPEHTYDHDWVGQFELAELLGQEATAGGGSRHRGVDVVPCMTAEPMAAEVNEAAHDSQGHECADGASVSPVLGWSTVELLPDDGTILEYWPTDFSESNAPSAEADETGPHWDEGDLDVPDPADRADDFGSKTDAISRVTEATRAEQLAQEFLSSIGELSHQNREWLGEIILARGWSSTQTRVREFLGARFGMKVIYLAFKVAEAWRDCHAFDERIGECVPGPVWSSTSWPRLTWIESARLVEFFGEDASLEEIFDFVECEHQAWRNHTNVCRRFPRFKDYLLGYRLSRECQRPDLGWHATLDPRDERTFDGSRNPEYSRDCWEDSLPDHRCAVAVSRRIFRGECLGDFLFSPFSDFGLYE